MSVTRDARTNRQNSRGFVLPRCSGGAQSPPVDAPTKRGGYSACSLLGRGRGRGRWGKCPVAFVDVNRLADEGDMKVLLPFAGRKLAGRLDRFGQRIDLRGALVHSFNQDTAL